MWTRREFIQKLGLTGVFVSSGFLNNWLFAANKKSKKLTLLHTNDLHSRIEPFPVSDPKYGGLGGFARINALVQKIRSEEQNVLLLDSGDVYQGTPYFNFFKGEAEFKLMSMIGYDAGNIGNHEFDNGIHGITSQLKNLNFPLLNANYDFSGTDLDGKIPTHKVFTKGDIRIGVFGIGVDLGGYVEPQNRESIQYNDPVEVAEKMVYELRENQHCNVVICLSHLGYKSDIGEDCDLDFAKKTKGIDVILGGHSHTLMEKADRVKNADGKEVLINQVGWAGIALGRIDLYIDKQKNIRLADSQLLKVDGNLA